MLFGKKTLGLDLRQQHISRKGREILPCREKKMYIYIYIERTK